MKILAQNKKAYHKYEVLEKLEAGIVLTGQEVKSAKLNRGNLEGSFVVMQGETPRVLNVKIPAYQPKNTPADYDPERPRTLLLNKSEIKKLIGKTAQKGLTLVPLRMYTKRDKIKVEIALVKTKSKTDKREQIKKRDMQRDIERELKEKS